ncbi:CBS domain-containing protein [Niveispirillum sp. SYP-B3756]|uniref:hemolysin family protein n=1 Tax=Niveispirillum sp. SYP-B3756 TaxID=2662178 RepID=UPI001291F2C6|nr:hemolysin family protein [Niveispirillum sp. SYP-B3756]MQP67938.1 CBS domain-containing protein [Niveispirillum sp. SYP-B3756]
MADLSDSRSPREDGAEEQPSFSQQLRGWLRSILGVRGGDTLRGTIEELIEETGDTEPSMADGERALLANILKLRHRKVMDAMVPRADIVGVPLDISLPDLIRRFSDEAHSRMPVFREELDDVVGMVHIKDVLACVAVGKPFELQAITRDVLIVTPNMPVLDLLLKMRLARQHLALVVDEFGGIDGLISIEDLVEEIVGEIEDEHDEAEQNRLVPRPDGTLLVDARIPVETFEEQLGRFFDADELVDVDTLGGLVFSMAGRVPLPGETFQHESGLVFEIVEADPRRIKLLKVRNLRVPDQQAEEPDLLPKSA